MKKLVRKHPLAIRWMHWINFPVLFVMIWSGLLIYWANDVYKLHLGHTILFSFFPESVYKSLHLSRRLAEGMAFHFLFMWIFFINGLAYVLFTIFSGEWRYLLPNRRSFKEAWQVLLHDLHIRKTAPPQRKYNGAQKIAYTAIILMGLGSVLTGLSIYKPVQFRLLTTIFGGYGNARVIHFILTIGYCLFFLIHVIQVILAGWDNFQAMVTGFSVIKDAASKAPTPIVQPVTPIPIAQPATPAPKNHLTRRTVLSFTAYTLLGAAAWKAWFLLKDSAQKQGVQSPLRTALNVDEKIFKPTLSPNHLAKTYPTSVAARNVRGNGNVGLSNNGFDAAAWCLNVTKANGETLEIPLSELQTLPKTDFAFEFKCIEGWSQISWWGGVRLSDFIEHYNLQKEIALDYVGLATPDDQYYVGIDTPSAMHPQTLLCYEMNGKPLPPNHGAPLRLIIPIKYGVKNLKRIGKMNFSNERPPDYWFERGYDYYCGL